MNTQAADICVDDVVFSNTALSRFNVFCPGHSPEESFKRSRPMTFGEVVNRLERLQDVEKVQANNTVHSDDEHGVCWVLKPAAECNKQIAVTVQKMRKDTPYRVLLNNVDLSKAFE